MTAFGEGIARFVQTLATRKDVILDRVGEAVLTSIQTGSSVTGAPGQPVDTGALRLSWQRWYASPTHQIIATNILYAPAIEDGIGRYGPLTLRSQVGGFHSVKLTIAAFHRLVATETAKAPHD